MTAEDAPAVLELAHELFSAMDLAAGRRPYPAPGPSALIRHHHLLETDPGGAWVAEADGRVVGCSEAILREGIWGLSLFLVHTDWQSQGHGRRLFDAARGYGRGARGGIILSSSDQRAMRLYVQAGYELLPAIGLAGTIRDRPPPPPEVREGRWPGDRELLDETSRHARGAAHGADIGAMIASGARLLVHEEGGFAVMRNDELKLLAARDDAIATAVLRAVLAHADAQFEIESVTAAQSWAVRLAVDAGLSPRVEGPVLIRGEVGPMRPYIPSGSYL